MPKKKIKQAVHIITLSHTSLLKSHKCMHSDTLTWECTVFHPLRFITYVYSSSSKAALALI